MSVIVSVFVSMLSPKPELSCATELAWVSSSTVTLTPFLSPLPRTTPDIVVVLPDSGRCELAVRQRFVGRSDPGVAALDQESSTCLIALVLGAQALRPRCPTGLATRAMCAGGDAGLVFSDYLQGQKYPAGDAERG